MDIKNIKQIESATQFGAKDVRKIGFVILFMFATSLIALICSDA